jgi:hypothetical protein
VPCSLRLLATTFAARCTRSGRQQANCCCAVGSREAGKCRAITVTTVSHRLGKTNTLVLTASVHTLTSANAWKCGMACGGRFFWGQQDVRRV